MRTFMYHPDFPLGKIFDTTGETAPKPPTGGGWVEHRGELNVTTDQIVEAAVKEELRRQGEDRPKLDAEHRKMYGEDPHGLARNSEVERVMDTVKPTHKRRS